MADRKKHMQSQDVSVLMQLSLSGKKELASRYVALARAISKRSRVSMREYNRIHCRKCSASLRATPGIRVRTRTTRGAAMLVYTCSCGHSTRMPLHKMNA